MIRPALPGIWLLLWLAGGRTAAAEAGPAGLLWPTDAGRCVTSSFCEFRPGHFHSGIDISTGGKVGFRCLAAGDGEIARARVSCGGYGRAVYLKLEDGRTVVYAHLSRFAGALADTVFARQTAQRSAYLDVTFPDGTFPVGRGDLVAWTGQSGVGVPHLHVEVRDALERPLDPLGAGFRAPDSAAPAFTRVALTPLTPRSSVDGSSEQVILDVHPGEDPARGRVPRAIPVEGEIGISVEVDETTDACRFRLAPHRLELREAGQTLYAVEYDRFGFSETGWMDLQIDPRLSYRKEGRFHQLWRRAGNTLAFAAAGGLAAGRIGAGEESGERALEMVALDSAGNRGSVTLTLSFAPPPDVTVLSARLRRASEAEVGTEARLGEAAWTDSVEVFGAVRVPKRALRRVRLEASLDRGQTWIAAPDALLEPGAAFRASFPLPPRIPGQGIREVIVRAQAVDRLGLAGLPKTVAVDGSPPPPSPPEFEIVTQGPWFELRFPGHVPWNALAGGVAEGQPVLVRPWGRGARIVLRPVEWSEPVAEWPGDGAEWKGFDPWGRPVPIRFTVPARVTDGGSAVSSRGLARYRFPRGACSEDAFALVREKPAPAPGRELRPVGPLHFLDTGQVPFLDDYVVKMSPEDGTAFEPDRLGIFVQQASGDLRYIGTTREEDGWTAATRTLLGIGLFEDAVPPALGEPRLEERHGRTRLIFRARDEGSGLGCDAVEVLSDGVPVLHELDDETGDVVAYPLIAPGPGAGGLFEMRVTDRCGNTARRTERVELP